MLVTCARFLGTGSCHLAAISLGCLVEFEGLELRHLLDLLHSLLQDALPLLAPSLVGLSVGLEKLAHSNGSGAGCACALQVASSPSRLHRQAR